MKRKKNTTKKERRNWSLLSWRPSIKSLLSSYSGPLDYYFLITIALVCIAIYNGINIFLVKKALWHGSYEVVAFLIFSILYNSKLKYKIDLILEFLLCIAVIVVAPKGTFSGIPFLFLMANRAKRNEHYYIIMAVSVLSISANIIVYHFEYQYIFALIFLYVYFAIKYYFNFHIPTQKLKAENEALKIKLSIVGTAKHLTDDEILHWFPVMEHNGDDEYLKIKMLRDFSNGDTPKVLAVSYKCTTRTVDRYFNEMKRDFGVRIGEDIHERQHLIKAGVMLDIIQVIVRQKEY